MKINTETKLPNYFCDRILLTEIMQYTVQYVFVYFNYKNGSNRI